MLIKAIDNPFESIDFLNFVQEDVVILSLRGNSGIKVFFQLLAVQ